MAVFVENRPGASSTIAAAAVAKAAPNGFTLLLSISLPLTTAPALFSKLPYDAGKDFAPVAQLYRGGSFLIANNSFAGNSLADLVLAARRKPNSINYASYGPGSTAHLGFELLQDATGIELVHVPYKTSAVPDLMRGEVTVGWEPAVSAMPFITDGKIKALAYTGNPRSPARDGQGAEPAPLPRRCTSPRSGRPGSEARCRCSRTRSKGDCNSAGSTRGVAAGFLFPTRR